MDPKTIEQTGKDLQKATNDPPYLIKTLADLKSGVKASEELLRATKIGVAVNKLKVHKDAAVSKQAADLVNKWKTDIQKSKNAKQQNLKEGTSKSGDDKENSKNVNGSRASVEQDGKSADSGTKNEENGTPAADEKFQSKVPLEQRSSKTDKVETNKTGDSTRDSCLKLMYDGLVFMSEEPPSHILPIAISIETSCFTLHASTTSATYKAKIRSLFQNLKNKSNPTLRQRVISSEISPDVLVRMTSEELQSPERRAEDLKIQKTNMDKAMVPQEEKSISGTLTCNKCKQKRVAYSQAQTRSADEPMTTFCECTNCGARWKFS